VGGDPKLFTVQARWRPTSEEDKNATVNLAFNPTVECPQNQLQLLQDIHAGITRAVTCKRTDEKQPISVNITANKAFDEATLEIPSVRDIPRIGFESVKERINHGKGFYVIFDAKDDIGDLVKNGAYIIEYSPANMLWTTTGFAKVRGGWTGAPQVFGVKNGKGDPEKGSMNLWNAEFTFDEDERVFIGDKPVGQPVGRLVFFPTPRAPLKQQ
jgi:hypothetical protein